MNAPLAREASLFPTLYPLPIALPLPQIPPWAFQVLFVPKPWPSVVFCVGCWSSILLRPAVDGKSPKRVPRAWKEHMLVTELIHAGMGRGKETHRVHGSSRSIDSHVQSVARKFGGVVLSYYVRVFEMVYMCVEVVDS